MNVSLIGVKSFPTTSTIFVGLNENQHVILKKMIVKISNATVSVPSDKNGFTPISKETLPALGSANNGPIAK